MGASRRECERPNCCVRGHVSRPNVTDDITKGLTFARACVLDQRSASHNRAEHNWDERYAEALAAIDFIVGAHKRLAKKLAKKAERGAP